MKDQFKIRVREDGSVVITSGSFSGEKHLDAEQFRAWIQKRLGGESTTIRNTESHEYAHEHGLEHDHEH